MVHINQVELTHFKSFGGSITIPLEPGFTVVTGPNGSGKSNILDAILFCLGLASSRGMRAERLPDLVSIDVDTVVQEAISRHKVAADNADITVDTDPPSGYRVLGDQALLVTAVANLISNAIAYSPDGSTVSISRSHRGDQIEIAVTDRGIGIALADQERVFERFFRVDKARSRATGGTGLGLAIVKHVAANHNGSIRLWSRPGTGSTFTLSIPVYAGEPADAEEEL